MDKPTPETKGAPASATSRVDAGEARGIAREAYVFGLPLVYIATQVEAQTNVPRPLKAQAPINQFAHYREFPDATNQTIVGLNVDTLYSIAGLDLSAEPLVLSIPRMGGRFWIMQLLDAWNNVPHAPGSRTVGGAGGNFAVLGPSWRGTLPAGLTELRMPTNLAMLGGRTYTAGPADYPAVHALQDQYRLVPLSRWSSRRDDQDDRDDRINDDDVPVKPGVDTETPIPRQVAGLSAEAFFSRLNRLMAANPPFPADAPVLARAAQLGIKLGARFNFGALDAKIRAAVEDGVAAGLQDVHDEEPKLGEFVNGWTLARDMGRYGTKYAYRAAWTYFGVGGNLAEDAIYPFSVVDGDGQPYDAANRYVLHFTKEQLPPVNAFWSLTLYDPESYLVPNPINRYALGDRSGLTFGNDGSLTLHIQRDSPGPGKETNWLPAPKEGGFKLAMRLYGPKPPVIDGSWAPPPVRVLH